MQNENAALTNAELDALGFETIRSKPSVETIAISDNSPERALHLCRAPSAQSDDGQLASDKAPKAFLARSERSERSYLLSGSEAEASPPKGEAAGDASRGVLQSLFPDHIPNKPYCSDNLDFGIRPRKKIAALQHRFIQLNGPATFEWMPFDVDRAGAYFSDDDANLPPANVVMVNKKNGHAHLAYLLSSPVAKHSLARIKPLEYFASVQRGYTNRLEADKHFCGLILKNPAHSDWHVEWRRDDPYSLDELNDWLFDKDKRFDPRPEAQFGAGRNVTTFDELRTFAYREVLKFKAAGGSLDAFRSRLEDVALGLNTQFVSPLKYSEVRAISKSVAKWTWRRFSPDQFSRIQSHRGKLGNAKRWAGHEAESKTEPWQALGISRATYYRRKAANALD